MTAYYLHFSGNSITLGAVLATGGEATVYTVAERPDLLAKLYVRQFPDTEDKLMAMIAEPPPCLSLGGGYAELIWPLDIIKSADTGDCVGFTMRYVQNCFSLDLIANPKSCPQEIDFACRVRMAANLAWMVSALHASGHAIGDLHLGNVLGSRTGCIYFIDADSFQFIAHGRLFRCRVGKFGYIPPELHNRRLDAVDRTTEQDAFSLATAIFQLLMANHPYAAQWLGKGNKPPLQKRIIEGWWPHAQPAWQDWQPRRVAPPFDILPMPIRDAFTRCFQDGHRNPGLRPSASEWHQLLVAVEKDQEYIDRVERLFQKATWRSTKRTPRVNVRRQAATGTPRTKRLAVACWRTIWAQLRKKPFIGLTAAAIALSAAVGMLYGLYVASPLQRAPPAIVNFKKYGVGKPTPQLWQDLRDSSD